MGGWVMYHGGCGHVLKLGHPWPRIEHGSRSMISGQAGGELEENGAVGLEDWILR